MEIDSQKTFLATANGNDIHEIHAFVRADDDTYWWDIEDGLDGGYTIKVKAWDNLGNEGESWSEVFRVSDMRVLNLGFEDDQYWLNGVPACWIEYGTGAKGQSSAQSHGGGHSLHLHRSTPDDYFGIYQQRIPCEPNTTYWLSGWMKTEGVTDGQASMGLGIWEPYSNHTDFAYLTETTEWTYVYGAWTSGPDETEMRVSLYGTPDFTGDAYFDDLELVVDDQAPFVGGFYAPSSFEPGQDITINFYASDNVAIEEVHFFYASNACGPWSGIGNVNPRNSVIDSVFTWTIPSSVPVGKDCFLKMVVVDPQGGSEQTEFKAGQFIDTQYPQVSIVFPTVSANVGIGDTCTLVWNATDNGEIEFDSLLITHNFEEPDEYWRFISAVHGRDTAFQWVIEGPPSNKCRIQAISYDMAGNKTEVISLGNFSVCGLASSNKECTAGPTKLQVDSQGKLHLVFAKDGFVYYATRGPGDEIWTRSILGTGTGPSISYNDNWLAMTWADGNELWYSTVEPNSQEPTPAQKLATLAYSLLKPSIVLDGSSPPVAYITWSGQDHIDWINASALFYGTLNVNDLSTFDYDCLFDAYDLLAYADPWIDVDESNTPHIVAVFPNNAICYLVKESGSWITHEVGSQGSYPSIDIKDQHVYLVWENSSNVWETHFPVGSSPGQIENVSKSSRASTSPVIVSGHALWSEDISSDPIPKWQTYHSRFDGTEWTDAEDIDGLPGDVNEHFPQGVMEGGIEIQQDYVRYATLHRVCASGTESRGYEIKYGSDVRKFSRLLSGHISEDFELQEHTYVTGDVIVDSGVTLTLSPGISLFFTPNADDQMAGKDTARCEFIVKGQLKAVGNDSMSVTFTSADTLPQTGDWCGISFESTDGSVDSLVFCKVEYADIGIEIEKGKLEISNSEIEKNKIGIEASGGEITAKWNKIVDNDSVGVIAHVVEGVDFGADGNHGNNRIRDNGNLNFQNLAPDSIYAQWNYWGTWNEDSVTSTIEGPIVFAPIVTPCPPKLVSPLPGESVHGFSILLDWVDVMGDTVLYALQWDTDSTFPGAIEVPDIVASEYTFDSDTLEAVTIFWRVKATNAEADSCWSGMSSFEFDLPTTYWVDGVTGNDNNPGTREAAWKTIQHAADVMGPWERVFVRAIPGTYDEQVVPATSGQPGNGIYYQSYPGDEDRAVVGDDNSNLFGFKLRKVSHIFIDGFEIRGQSIAAIDISSSEGVASSHNVVRDCNIVSGDVLNCIHIWGNTPCVGNTIENCSVDICTTSFYAVNLTNAPSTRILTTDIEGGTYACRIDHDCDSVQIGGSSIRNIASYGIYAYSNNDGLRITDNTFHDAGENAAVYLSQNKGATVTGNRVDSTQATAIIWLDTKCYNSIVSDNVITMNLPNSGFGIRLRYDNDSVLVSGNTITGDCGYGSAGIYLDQKNSNVQITGNTVDSAVVEGIVIGGASGDNDDVWVSENSVCATDIGIHIEKRTQERVRIVNNFLYSSNHCIYNYGGETAFIAHNSISTETGTGIFVDQNMGSTDDCTLRNNVVYSGSGYCLKLNLFFSPDGWDSDYNDLYTETGNVGRWGNTDTPTLSDWQSESDGDQHSISVDPLYVSATNLHIAEQSPCRDIGTPISWITTDIDGELRDSLRDIGADEWYEQTGGGTMAGTVRDMPIIFRLKQNRPNPFRQLTTIDYSIPRAGRVTLRIYDVTGRMVKELVNKDQKAGMHTTTWKGKTPRSKKLATGVYFIRLCAGDKTATKKLVLVR